MKIKQQTQRLCIVCKQMRGKNELIRIVKSPSGEIAIDPTGKANGRGAYICTTGTCLKDCQKKRALHRAFKTTVDEAVYARLIESEAHATDD